MESCAAEVNIQLNRVGNVQVDKFERQVKIQMAIRGSAVVRKLTREHHGQRHLAHLVLGWPRALPSDQNIVLINL